MDGNVKAEGRPGQPQQRVAAPLLRFRPEGGQQIFRVQSQLVTGGIGKIRQGQRDILQIGNAQARKDRQQHARRGHTQQTQHHVGRL